ncbi:MAG: arginine--tRNA ligase [Atribacterota bacterium]|nr:arginine--tRNA ligase [Atribacterota bacterium]MDD5497273.1 arginine--tRNA ligase [Atribacterota bacterium]
MLNKTNNDLQQLIRDSILKYLKNKEIDFVSIPVIMLTTPKNPAHGHLSTNIALQLSAIISDAPSNIAQFIVQEIEKKKPGILDKIEVASPGFINFYFKNDVLYNILPEIITQKSQFGHSNIGQGEKVLVEFVSVNPTGPLHIGHGKCAVVGDSLSKILKAAGYEVSTEYYINDHGKQIDILGESVLVRYRQLLGEDIEFPANGYQGNYIVDLAKEIMNEYQEQFKGKNDQDTIHFFKDYAQERILKDIKEDLFSFGVQFDNWFSEQSLYTENKVHPVIERLKKEGFVYLNKGALWFKSTDFGDEKDRVVIRKDGEATYFASDIAYHDDKYKRGFNILIDIWGADHHGYINRMKAAIQALGYTKDSFQVLLVQFVTLLQGGKAVGMSTRGGQFITLKDLLKEVGKDVARYFFLMYSHDSHTEFDLDIAKSQSMDNPVFYIQYAYARICSIIEKGQSKNIILIDQKKEQIDLKLLDKKEELELIKKMAYFKEVIERSALQRKPYLIASYLYELASLFHKYYTEYKVISEDRELSEARLYLIYAVKIVLENALTLLGIQAPEKM